MTLPRAYRAEEYLRRMGETVHHHIGALNSQLPEITLFEPLHQVVVFLEGSLRGPGQLMVPPANVMRILLSCCVRSDAQSCYNLQSRCQLLLEAYLQRLEDAPDAVALDEVDDDNVRYEALRDSLGTAVADLAQPRLQNVQMGVRDGTRGQTDISKFFAVAANDLDTDDPNPISVLELLVSPDDLPAFMSTDDKEALITRFHSRQMDIIKLRPIHTMTPLLPISDLGLELDELVATTHRELTSSPVKRVRESTPLELYQWHQIELVGEQLIGKLLNFALSGYSFWDLVVWWGDVTHESSKRQVYGQNDANDEPVHLAHAGYGWLLEFVARFCHQPFAETARQELIGLLGPSKQLSERSVTYCLNGMAGASPRAMRAPTRRDTRMLLAKYESKHRFVSQRPSRYSDNLHLVATRARLFELVVRGAKARPQAIAARLARKMVTELSAEYVAEFFAVARTLELPRFWLTVASLVLRETGTEFDGEVIPELVLEEALADEIIVVDEPVDGVEAKREAALRYIVAVAEPSEATLERAGWAPETFVFQL